MNDNATPKVAPVASPGLDRWINWLLVGIFAVMVVSVILALVTYPKVVDVDAGVEAQAKSDEVSGCRSQSAARVTDARTTFDIARSKRDTEATHLDDLIAQGLEAVAAGDEDRLMSVRGRIAAARERLATAEQVVVDSTTALEAENARHTKAVELSTEDPGAFRALCRNDFRPGG